MTDDDVINIIEQNEQDLKLPPKPAPLVEEVYFRQPPVKVMEINPTAADRWTKIKKEFLEDREVDVIELAKKYDVEPRMLYKRIGEERWESERKNIFARADAIYQNSLTGNLAEVKARHAKYARALQQMALKSLRKQKQFLSPKEALAYMDIGVKMEREAHGLGKDQPKIVNIITQQQAIVDKYKK